VHQQPQLVATTNPTTLRQVPNYTKQAWLLIGSWALFLAVCLLARGGRFIAPLFPLGSVGVGLFLYFRTPGLYVGYTWWMCFLGALIRRIIDYQSGFITAGRWSLTATLVASICLITLVRYLPKTAWRRGGMPFILSSISVIYAFVVGLIFGKYNSQYLVGALEWIAPIAFGFHLSVNWQHYPNFRQIIGRCFGWGVLVMGAYGIFQYCTAPDWDRFYLNNIDATSFGLPLPFEIRVFGTQTAPQTFATVMMAGLLLLFGSEDRLRFLASGVGYLSFLLSMARSGWLGWAVGTITFFPLLKPRLQMRFATTIVVMVLLIVPLVTMEPFAEVINGRLESFSNPEDDVSLQGRTEGYNDALQLAVMEVTGQGLGSVGPKTDLGASDSGILPLLFSLGWAGAIPYIGGILLILFQLMQNKDKGKDPFSCAARAIALGTLSQVWFNNVFSDVLGLVLWGFLGIGLAANQYYSSQRLEKGYKGISTNASSTRARADL